MQSLNCYKLNQNQIQTKTELNLTDPNWTEPYQSNQINSLSFFALILARLSQKTKTQLNPDKLYLNQPYEFNIIQKAKLKTNHRPK